MDIGIGLPNSLREANGRALVEFARRADAAGFMTTVDPDVTSTIITTSWNLPDPRMARSAPSQPPSCT